MDPQTNPFLSMLVSRKTWSAVIGTILVGIPVYFHWNAASPDAREHMLIAAIVSIAAI